MYYGLSTGYSRKKSIHKFFGTVLKKNHELAKGIDLQFRNLKFSQKGILDFHVTTATADVCMKEVIDRAGHFKEKLGHAKSINFNDHRTKFSQWRSLSYLQDSFQHKQFTVPFIDSSSRPEVFLNISQN